MSGRFGGRGLVVTGGTRGIGRAVVLAAAAQGADVVFCARSGADAAELEAVAPGRVHFVPADVADEADVEQLFDFACDQLPAIDVLVNNAGISRDALLVQHTLADWLDIMAVNLRGPFLTCRRAVGEMLTQDDGGRIVNVASFTANGLAGAAGYAASKSALLSLTRSIAKEYGRRGIACNAVVPGFVDTDMTRDYPDAAKRRLAALSPHNRFGTPEEIADAVLFLASAEASFVTGDALYVSGAVHDVPRLTS